MVCSADVRLEDNSVPQHIAKTRRRQARGHKPERDTRHQVGIDKSCWKKVRALALVSAMMGIAAHAQTFTTLVNFSGPNGAIPTYESLVQGIDGNFYGTTSLGTSQNLGTVFVMNPQGQLRTLHNFDGTDGANPQAGLMAAPNGMLYGTTSYGGANGDYGTIFQITPNGTLTTLHSFSGTDGANP